MSEPADVRWDGICAGRVQWAYVGPYRIDMRPWWRRPWWRKRVQLVGTPVVHVADGRCSIVHVPAGEP